MEEKSQFSIFKSEAEYWLNYFGLTDWGVTFETEPLTDTVAETRFQFVAKRVLIVLNSDCSSDDDIKQTAFHEVCEVLLGNLYYQAERACTSDYQREMIAMAGHDIIRRLENTVYRDMKRP